MGTILPYCAHNVILLTLSRLIMDQFVAVGSQYGITTFTTAKFDTVYHCSISVS